MQKDRCTVAASGEHPYEKERLERVVEWHNTGDGSVAHGLNFVEEVPD